MEWEHFAGFGVPPKPDFWIGQGVPNTPPIHVAFRAETRAIVDRVLQGGDGRRRTRQRSARVAAALPRALLRRVRARSGWAQHRGGLSCSGVSLRSASSSRSRWRHGPAASAQPWPDKPIKFVVAAPARQLARHARRARSATSSRIASGSLSSSRTSPPPAAPSRPRRSRKAAPDGYTMLLGFNGPLAFGPLLQKLPYDVAEGPGAGDHHVEPAQRARRQRRAAREDRCRSSSPTRRPIPASSTTRRSATAARRTSTWSS